VRQYHYAACPVGCSDDHPELGVTATAHQGQALCGCYSCLMARIDRDNEIKRLTAKLAEAERRVAGLEGERDKAKYELETACAILYVVDMAAKEHPPAEVFEQIGSQVSRFLQRHPGILDSIHQAARKNEALARVPEGGGT
jgi:hypothetical protein